MNFKRFMVIFWGGCLVAVLVFLWGCQNQPTGPQLGVGNLPVSGKTRGTGSCTAGSYRVSFSGSFVAGLGWSTGSTRSISWSGSCSGCSWGPGVYGWLQNPLVEYYIPRSGGSNRGGSYSCNGRSYQLQVHQQVNQPSIEGTKTFDQYFASGGGGNPIDMGCHYNGWRNAGASVGSNNYQVVAVENWSGGSGSASVSVPNSNWYTLWIGSGSASFTCGGGGGGSTTTSGGGGSTTTSGGGGGGGGNISYTLRARSTDGQGRVNLRIDNNTIATWTLGTGMSNYSASSYNTGGINVEFFNDADNRDVQVDYLVVNGSTRQAENQSYNTAVWQNGSCGGSNSEWMHCNGIIGFGDTPGGSSGGGGGSTTSTTTSGSSWWGGGSWW
jgi:endo-1,4-beta-xylanase